MGIIALIFRLIGFISLLIGIIAFGFLSVIFFMNNHLLQQKLGQVWYDNDPFTQIFETASLPFIGAFIERKIHPILWDPMALFVLDQPTWIGLLILTAVFGGLGWLLMDMFKSNKIKKRQ